MTLIERYMVGRLATVVAAILAVVTIEELLQKSQPVYVLVASGDLPLSKLLLLWLNLLPLIFYHSTPEIVAIALAYRYYWWGETNELVALKNAGLSGFQIARPGIVTAALFALFCAVNSLWLMPSAWTRVEDIRLTAVKTVNPELLQPGYQQEVVSGLSIEFAHRLDDGTLTDIVVFDAREDSQFRILWAKSGQFVEAEGKLVLRLEKGSYHVHNTTEWYTADFDSLSLPLRIDDPAALPPRVHGYYEQDIWALFNPPWQIRGVPELRASWLTEGHQRISAPLMCLGVGLLVLGLLVPGNQSRTRRVSKLLVAIVAALAAATLPTPLASLTVRYLELLPCFYLLAVVPGVAGLGLLILGGAPGRRRLAGAARLDEKLAEKPL